MLQGLPNPPKNGSSNLETEFAILGVCGFRMVWALDVCVHSASPVLTFGLLAFS